MNAITKKDFKASHGMHSACFYSADFPVENKILSFDRLWRS